VKIMLKKYDEYIQNLLIAQYKVSGIIEHNLTKGEVREDFLKDMIIERLPKYRAVNGVIVDPLGRQSPQCDCILLKSNAQTRKIGKQEIVDIEDVLFVIEIKSNAKGTDLKKFNDDIKKIKKMQNSNDRMKFILFGYEINLKHLTILKRFKHNFDSYIKSIYLDPRGNEMYPNIDILLNLSSSFEVLSEEPCKNKPFILQRIEKIKGSPEEYFYNSNRPIIREFFGILK